MNKIDFIKSMYRMSNVELNNLYRNLRNSRNKLLQEIANIILNYTVENNIMVMSISQKNNLLKELTDEVNSFLKDKCTEEIKITNVVLEIVINETFKYHKWNYNIGFDDVRKIINNSFKGKHFSTRVWDEEVKVAEKLHRQIKDFLYGKINVNQIRKEIENTFNSSAYNAKRLVETEVGRVHDESFKKFCSETGVERVKRNEILDAKTCNDCAEYDGEIYELDKAPILPVHPMCRGFYEIVD